MSAHSALCVVNQLASLHEHFISSRIMKSGTRYSMTNESFATARYVTGLANPLQHNTIDELPRLDGPEEHVMFCLTSFV